MLEIGGVVAVVGLVLFVYGLLQKAKAGRVADAPLASTGDVLRRGQSVAGPKGQISAQGNVVCQQPITAPFSGLPCLFYKLTARAEWKEGDQKKTKVIEEQKLAAQFAIDDGSGPVWVDATEGGDFDGTQKKKETKGVGLMGAMLGSDLMFGNFRVNTAQWSSDTKFTVEEEILPLQPRMYACGKLGEQGGVIKAPNWRSLILSGKSRDELFASATKSAKMNLAAGVAALLVGGGLSGTGYLLADDAPPPVTASVAAANKPVAPVVAPPPVVPPIAAAIAPAVAASPAPVTPTKEAKEGKAAKGKAKKGTPKTRGASAKR